MTDHDRWLHRRGELALDRWETVVDGSLPGWRPTGLRIGELGGDDGASGAALELPAGDVERMVVPLRGTIRVEHDGDGGGVIDLAPRRDVFDGPADVVYLGVGVGARLTGEGRVAVAEAPATERIPVQVMRASEVPVELRGAGSATRQVHNFGVPGALRAQKLIVCEVITPSGNWSSHPPHKHDEPMPGVESRLEEIYWFEAAVARGLPVPERADPIGVFAAYDSPAGAIDVTALVRSGDTVLVPHGYHGPAGAIPGYDLYYLNVMAGPDPERSWLITDDPDQTWVRETWTATATDARLPYTASGSAGAENTPATEDER